MLKSATMQRSIARHLQGIEKRALQIAPARPEASSPTSVDVPVASVACAGICRSPIMTPGGWLPTSTVTRTLRLMPGSHGVPLSTHWQRQVPGRVTVTVRVVRRGARR